MNADEATIAGILTARGLAPERFPDEEACEGKRPDFRIHHNGALIFYCEVKSVSEDRWLAEHVAAAPPGTIVGGGRPDPIFNRLTDDIHTAVKQFDAVNPDLTEPNVLAFVNHDRLCDLGDLLAILTGDLFAEDGSRHPIYRRFSHGRVRADVGRIHLFIWIERDGHVHYLFSDNSPEYYRLLCGLFGRDPDGLPEMP